MVGLPLVSALCLVLLGFSASIELSVAALALIGFCYGAIIAVYPFAIAIRFGDREGPKVYGRVFTAWGFAGLVAPWTAGLIFDWSGGYAPALVVAAVIAGLSALAAASCRFERVA